MECQLCNIAQDPDQIIRFQNELVLYAEADKYQDVLKHSGIIIPKAHKETVFDLSSEELSATFSLLAEVKAWMDGEFAPDGYNLGWNCGMTAGQFIPHAHLHVIPRFQDEPLAGKGIRYYLKSGINKW